MSRISCIDLIALYLNPKVSNLNSNTVVGLENVLSQANLNSQPPFTLFRSYCMLLNLLL